MQYPLFSDTFSQSPDPINFQLFINSIGESDIGDVVSVTVDSKLVTICGCWWLNFDFRKMVKNQMAKTVTNIFQQHISSPTSVTNIDVTIQCKPI